MRVVALESAEIVDSADEFTGRMFEAINGMLLETLASVAR